MTGGDRPHGPPRRFAVLVSGTGSNLQALLDRAATGVLAPAEIVAVASNRPEAAALDRARAAGVPAIALDHRSFPSREAFEDALLAALAPHAPDAIVLAGFMRVLTPRFLGAFPDRVINTHPSLLPAFAGAGAIEQALAYGVTITGCTVHFVDAGVDQGPIIAQRAVPIAPGDDATIVRARIQAAEHALVPAVVRALAQGRISCEGRRVVVVPGGDPDDADQLL
ncbi:MAG: phosphoribosylglycinamide formyltransferase [Deltaproteobacteria bacterium]|nr:phosphoribosylglycinamide formyltransferase [Deltaproteobacteria bacterium]